MESSLPQDLESHTQKHPLSDDKDLLGDFGVTSLPSKVEMPSRTSASPEPLPVTPEPMPLTPDRRSLTPELASVTPEHKGASPEPKLATPDPKSATPEPNLFDNEQPKKETLLDPLSTHDDPFSAVKVTDSNIPDLKISDVKSPSNPLSEVRDFLDELKSDTGVRSMAEEPFGFNKPLPPEPYDSTVDFLKSETTASAAASADDENDPMNDFVGAHGDSSPATFSREESPIPPPVPKHQNLRDDSPDRFESSPEPDFKPMDSGKEARDTPEPPPPVAAPTKEEPKSAPKESKKTPVSDIGAKDIIVEIGKFFPFYCIFKINLWASEFGTAFYALMTQITRFDFSINKKPLCLVYSLPDKN